MLGKDLATIKLGNMKALHGDERRGKFRFPMERDLRYKLLKDGATLESGIGLTVDVGSSGIGFSVGRDLAPGNFIELSISWPVMLQDSCAMRLIVFGRVVRSDKGKSACTVDKYEFRTQARTLQPAPARNDGMLKRWADTVRKDGGSSKLRLLSA